MVLALNAPLDSRQISDTDQPRGFGKDKMAGVQDQGGAVVRSSTQSLVRRLVSRCLDPDGTVDPSVLRRNTATAFRLLLFDWVDEQDENGLYIDGKAPLAVDELAYGLRQSRRPEDAARLEALHRAIAAAKHIALPHNRCVGDGFIPAAAGCIP